MACYMGPELLPTNVQWKILQRQLDEKESEWYKYAVFITNSLDAKNRETCPKCEHEITACSRGVSDNTQIHMV